MNLALLTIIRNEASFFLPIWYKYYSRFFEDKNIYILNNDSEDNYIEVLNDLSANPNIIDVPNEAIFDHKWLRDTVQEHFDELLYEYDGVMFVEIDEIIGSTTTPHMLYWHLCNSLTFGGEAIKVQGFDLIGDVEDKLNVNRRILNQIKYGRPNPIYNKTLISRVPLHFTLGFHNITNTDVQIYEDPDLVLLHLHRVDYAQYLIRKISFLSKEYAEESPTLGQQNKYKTVKEIIDYFSHDNAWLIEVPEKFKTIPL